MESKTSKTQPVNSSSLVTIGGGDVVDRLQNHLKLLREEHVQLQQSHAELRRKFDILKARQHVQADENDETPMDSSVFVTNLVRIVEELFEKDLYSDITIHLDGHQLRAHRFVLAARSHNWGVDDLTQVDRLDFDGISYSIGRALLRWIYTDDLDTALGDKMLLELMKAARRYSLMELNKRCECILIARLDIANSIPIYVAAEEMEADRLRDKCVQMITSRWADFGASDFLAMSAQLLYKMLRSRDQFPLHSAIRLRREDVVFLYLIEYASSLRTKLNECDSSGCVPLSLALSTAQESIAATLVTHDADVNTRQDGGHSLLFAAVLNCDMNACRFLLSHGADVHFRHSVTGNGVLHALAENAQPDAQQMDEMLTLLLDHEKAVNVNGQNTEGSTCMHVAVTCGNWVFVSRLLHHLSAPHPNHQLDLNVSDNQGRVVLGICLKQTVEEFHSLTDWYVLMEKMVLAGANVNFKDNTNGNSLLHENIDRTANVDFLLKHGADIAVTNNKGASVLHLACGDGNLDLVNTLLHSVNDSQLLAKLLSLQTVHSDTDEVGGETCLHSALANMHVQVAIAVLKVSDSNGCELNLQCKDSNGNSVLALALLADGEEQLCSELVRLGADMNEESATTGDSLLIRFIEAQNQPAALFLIRNAAQLHKPRHDGVSALQLAVSSDLPQVVRALCRAGADMNVRDSQGLVPLWNALNMQYIQAAEVLVEQGCDVDAWHVCPDEPELEQTLLLRACDENDEDTACFLVQSKCSVNEHRRRLDGGRCQDGSDKQTALHMATAWGMCRLVDVLIQHHVNLNIQDVDGRTAVHLAIVNEHNDMLDLLLAAPDVSLNVKDGKGHTPFVAAMHANNNKAAQAILNRDRRVVMQFDNKGYNLLHTAVKQSNLENMLFLISVQLDVNTPTQDSSKYTALHLAAIAGHEMCTRNLILAGGNVNAVSGRQQSPLQLAAKHDHAEICAILLENGADFGHVDDSLHNALHMSVQIGSLSCVNVLLSQSGIDAEAVNTKGQTVLHLLACCGKENASTIFNVLMQLIPDFPIDRPDVDGNTALLLAYMNGQSQLCKSLVHAGAVLGATNATGVNIFNYQTPTKQLLFKMLDQLEAEPKWSDGNDCSECGNKFSLTTRKHHWFVCHIYFSRHCGRLLCAKCSTREMPILKYELTKPVRMCDVCCDVLTLGSMEENLWR